MSLESVYIAILFRAAAGCALDKMECCPICTANISAKKSPPIFAPLTANPNMQDLPRMRIFF